MTQQISNYLEIGDRQLEIVGVKGNKFFDPRTFGLKFEHGSSCCWDGFFMTFVFLKTDDVDDQGKHIIKLFLKKLTGYDLLPNEWTGVYPWLSGVAPVEITDKGSMPDGSYIIDGNARFENVYLDIPFDGSLFAYERTKSDTNHLYEYQIKNGSYVGTLDHTKRTEKFWNLVNSNDISRPTKLNSWDTFGFSTEEYCPEAKRLDLGEKLLRGDITPKMLISMFPKFSPQDLLEKFVSPVLEARFKQSFGEDFRFH